MKTIVIDGPGEQAIPIGLEYDIEILQEEAISFLIRYDDSREMMHQEAKQEKIILTAIPNPLHTNFVHIQFTTGTMVYTVRSDKCYADSLFWSLTPESNIKFSDLKKIGDGQKPANLQLARAVDGQLRDLKVKVSRGNL